MLGSFTNMNKNQLFLELTNREILSDNIFTPWTRPNDWPDLDSLNLELSGTSSFIYMTYRTGHIDDVFSCGWTLVSGYSIYIDYGTIENGQFVSILNSPYSYASNTTHVTWFTPANGYEEGYIVIKITGRFTKFYLTDSSRN